jgi:deoxyribose-phosphate aldolase
MRVEDLTKTLEQTLLDASIGDEALALACERVREHHVASLCVLPQHLPPVVDHLRGCDVKPAVAIDYPSGAHATAERVAQAERAVAEGAEEIDVVLNHRGMLAGEFGAVRDDLVRVMHAVRGRAANVARGDVLVTVTLEAPRLGEKLTRLACLIVDEAGADFAGTSTGVGGNASVHDVEIMRDALSESVGVRAAGGVHGLSAVQELVTAGAARVATADVATVLAELAALNGGGR